MATATPLGAFCNQLIRFFEELSESFPEEREIRMGLETIQGAKKINPKLILDLFYEHVYKEANVYVQTQDDDAIVKYAHSKIASQFNEMSPALLIFDKHWVTMSEVNRNAVWKYMKVLCLLCAKAKGISPVDSLKE